MFPIYCLIAIVAIKFASDNSWRDAALTNSFCTLLLLKLKETDNNENIDINNML
jgi:hypothetical protein